MRRVHIASVPPPGHLLQVIIRVLLVAHHIELRLLVPHRRLAHFLIPRHQVGRSLAGLVRRLA